MSHMPSVSDLDDVDLSGFTADDTLQINSSGNVIPVTVTAVVISDLIIQDPVTVARNTIEPSTDIINLTLKVGSNTGPLLHLEDTASGGTVPANTNLWMDASAVNYLAISAGATSLCGILMGDSGDPDQVRILSDNTNNSLDFWANGSEAMTIKSDGSVGIGVVNPLADLSIAGSLGVAVVRDSVPGGGSVLSLSGTGTHTATVSVINATLSTTGSINALLQQNGVGNCHFIARAASTGDAYFTAQINGGGSWSFGADNSDADKFKLTSSTILATAVKLVVQSNGFVGINDQSPGGRFSVNTTFRNDAFVISDTTGRVSIGPSGSGDLTVNGADGISFHRTGIPNGGTICGITGVEAVAATIVGITCAVNATNSLEFLCHNTGTSGHARFNLQVAAGSTADAYISFNLLGTQSWAIGIDNSDSDKFKIGTTNVLDNSPQLVIDTAGLAGINLQNPKCFWHVQDSSSGATLPTDTNLWVEGSAVNYLAITGGATSIVGILMGDSGDPDEARVISDNNTRELQLWAAATEYITMDATGIGFFAAAPVVQAAAYTRNATIVEDRTLLASASATTLNNNNVLAALIADLQAYGLLQ